MKTKTQPKGHDKPPEQDKILITPTRETTLGERARKNLGGPSQPTAHQVHTPEIEVTSATTARGIWALQDVVRFGPGVTLVGYGHYHETYEKTDGQWRIKTSKLTRLREDIVTPLFSVYISERVRNAAASAARRLTNR